MKKTIAVIGSAAALTFAGAGLAAAEEVDPVDTPATGNEVNEDGEKDDDVVIPEDVAAIAQQLCGTVSAYDFLGSAEGIAPGLSGEECEANASAAVAAAFSGDIGGALDILRGIDAELPDEDDAAGGSAELLGSLSSISGDAEENEPEA